MSLRDLPTYLPIGKAGSVLACFFSFPFYVHCVTTGRLFFFVAVYSTGCCALKLVLTPSLAQGIIVPREHRPSLVLIVAREEGLPSFVFSLAF